MLLLIAIILISCNDDIVQPNVETQDLHANGMHWAQNFPIKRTYRKIRPLKCHWTDVWSIAMHFLVAYSPECIFYYIMEVIWVVCIILSQSGLTCKAKCLSFHPGFRSLYMSTSYNLRSKSSTNFDVIYKQSACLTEAIASNQLLRCWKD